MFYYTLNLDINKRAKTVFTNGFEILFDKSMETKEDAINLVELVDCIMLLYIALCKK
jgi:hypothetical protein